MGYLLDTNHCIYIKNAMHKRAEKRQHMEQKAFEAFESALSQKQAVYLSMATLGELYFGAEKSVYQQKNYRKIAFFLRYVNLIETDRNSWELFGKTKAQLQQQGKCIADLDLLIACTAKAHHHILISGDADHQVLPEVFRIENWASSDQKIGIYRSFFDPFFFSCSTTLQSRQFIIQ